MGFPPITGGGSRQAVSTPRGTLFSEASPIGQKNALNRSAPPAVCEVGSRRASPGERLPETPSRSSGNDLAETSLWRRPCRNDLAETALAETSLRRRPCGDVLAVTVLAETSLRKRPCGDSPRGEVIDDSGLVPTSGAAPSCSRTSCSPCVLRAVMSFRPQLRSRPRCHARRSRPDGRSLAPPAPDPRRDIDRRARATSAI